MDGLALKALATTRALAALGIESFEAVGATFVRDRQVPRLVQSNYVTNVEASTATEIDVLFERLEVEYADAQHRRFEVDFTTPPEFEARLACEDYAMSTDLIMVLEGGLAGTPRVYDMRPVDSAEAWSIMADFKHRGHSWTPGDVEPEEDTSDGSEDALDDDPAYVIKCSSPPVRYWLAYEEGQAVAYCCAWEGIGGVGQIDDLVTRKDYRHRGIATALVHHCVADARVYGAGPVVAVTDAADTPKHMYATMGFRPVAYLRSYLKSM